MQTYFLIISAVICVGHAAFTMGPFVNVTGGVYDIWNQNSPQNVESNNFNMLYGDGKLWLISKRAHRPDFKNPWDSAVRGGIVSTFKIADETWTHTPYDRVDADPRAELLFSMRGRLYMLTYSVNQGKVLYHRLFVFLWNGGGGGYNWSEIPLEFERPPIETFDFYSYEISKATIAVPVDSNSKTVYLARSGHGKARGGSDMVFCELDLGFESVSNTLPTKATFKFLGRQLSDKPEAVFTMFNRGTMLYAFTRVSLSEGYASRGDNLVYTVNTTSGEVSNTSVSGSLPLVSMSRCDNAFQTTDDGLVFGGTQPYGLGRSRTLYNIWSLKLKNMKFDDTGAILPEGIEGVKAFDPENKRLYVGSLRNGISVSQITL